MTREQLVTVRRDLERAGARIVEEVMQADDVWELVCEINAPVHRFTIYCSELFRARVAEGLIPGFARNALTPRP